MANINGPAGKDIIKGTAQADTIHGLGGDDVIDGGLGIDTLYSDEGNDTLWTLHNIDTIDGGPGIDTAAFYRSRAEHGIVRTSWGFEVIDSDSTANYTGIERFQFSDKKLAFDLGPGEAAENTVRVIGAAVGAAAFQAHPDWIGAGLRLFDSGQTLAQVCALVTQVLGLSDVEFVKTVYRNIVGVEPDLATIENLSGALQQSLTQAQLLELAATSEFTATAINLVGLRQFGVAFEDISALPP